MRFVCLLLAPAVVACASDPGASDGAGGAGTTPGATGNGFLDDTTAATSGGDETCVAAEAQQGGRITAFDVIIAVDTSSGMESHVSAFNGGLASLVDEIEQRMAGDGLEARVVMIGDSSACMPAPLGTGACGAAGTQLPRFLHVEASVSASNLLDEIVSTYPAWKSQVRVGVPKTFWVVSNRDSPTSGAAFLDALRAADPGMFTDYPPLQLVHVGGAFASQVALCAPGAEPGAVYQALVDQTGGMMTDICNPDHDQLRGIAHSANGESFGVPCAFAIPPAPPGKTFDPSRINVESSVDGGTWTTIFNVPGGFADCGPAGGWYYDPPAAPTEVRMCPATCLSSMRGELGGVRVVFGCPIQVAPS